MHLTVFIFIAVVEEFTTQFPPNEDDYEDYYAGMLNDQPQVNKYFITY